MRRNKRTHSSTSVRIKFQLTCRARIRIGCTEIPTASSPTLLDDGPATLATVFGLCVTRGSTLQPRHVAVKSSIRCAKECAIVV